MKKVDFIKGIGDEMARGSKKAALGAAPAFGGGTGNKSERIDFTFVNVHFNGVDQQYLSDNWKDSPTAVFDWLADIPSGYKLSIAFDKQSGRYNATLACSLTDDQNFGLILSARGATPAAALYGLCYADMVKLDGQWKSAQQGTDALFG